jgi:hypothetical protein
MTSFISLYNYITYKYDRDSALKMESVCFSETLVSDYWFTRFHNPEEQRHQKHFSNVISRIIDTPDCHWATYNVLQTS